MDRKAYWNKHYYEYWKQRVEESSNTPCAESHIVEGDSKTEGDDVYREVFEEYPFRPGSILEVGCAWGRWFRVYRHYHLEIYGVDISTAMIEQAKIEWENERDVKVLQEAEAEALPFDDECFNNLTCIAVFDATYQCKALYEMLRVVKRGGLIYLTGKNEDYHNDDALALSAENGARNKGHPNFFTNTKQMIKEIKAQGHKIECCYYFPRRGDFAAFNYKNGMPDKYYEYLVVIKRGHSVSKFSEFSGPCSKTYRYGKA